jgi:ankyrin repeat protein
MAHHIALKLQEEDGYDVVPVDEIWEIKLYCDTKNPQVFLIDDAMGLFGLQERKLDVLTDYEHKIMQPYMAKSKTLMTCRETVFNETKHYKSSLTKEENIIKLHSSDHALDDTDKKQILQKYGLNANLLSPALLTSTSTMFPLLCKLFSTEKKFHDLGSNFFLYPVQCIIQELDGMQQNNKLHYATLILCLFNENSLSEDILNDQLSKKKIGGFLKTFISEQSTDTLMNALSAMEGTYTQKCGTQDSTRYTFIHDSMVEICAYHYGKTFPEQILEYMSSSYIANYVKPHSSDKCIEKRKEESDSQCSKRGGNSNVSEDRKEESNNEKGNDRINKRKDSFDLFVWLSEDQYPLLAKRLYRDIQNMDLYDVFRNQVLKHPQMLQAFIAELETKSYIELKFLFLSSRGQVDKIVSKRWCVVGDSEEWREEKKRQEVLVDQRQGKCPYNIRVISWVIYYGHHEILQYIIQQTQEYNEIGEFFRIPRQSKPVIFERERNTIRIKSKKQKKVERLRLLLLSCFSGDVETVRDILSVCWKAVNGVHVSQISKKIIWSYPPPLTAECKSGHISIVMELVRAGADVNRQGAFYTPLTAACEGGHVSVVLELLTAGADVTLQGALYTPLTAACEGGNVSVIKVLIKAGAGVNVKDREGNTPLIIACKRGHVDVVNELVTVGVDVNLQDNVGYTPITAACEGGHVSVVKELVKAGININLQDGWGNTPLIVASARGHVSVVKELVKEGVDINLQGTCGKTPLIVACKRGHASSVENLVKAGTSINVRDLMGGTPLISASKEGHVDVVKELLMAGADVNLQDNRGNMPLAAAIEGGHEKVMKELVSFINSNLVKHGAD